MTPRNGCFRGFPSLAMVNGRAVEWSKLTSAFLVMPKHKLGG